MAPSTTSEGPPAFRQRAVDVNLRSGPQMREYQAIADRVARDGLSPVLDWGCGHGQMSSMLVERGVTVESSDYREGEAPRVIDLPFPGLRAYLSGDPVALPFEDGRFAAVLALGVLEHVEKPEQSLRELRRVLRPGGRLYIYKLPNRHSYLEAIAKRLGFYYHGALPHDRVYDARSAAAIVSGAGFRVERVRHTNMLPLTVSGALVWRLTGAIWALNRLLALVPGLNLLSTNIEVDAIADTPP